MWGPKRHARTEPCGAPSRPYDWFLVEPRCFQIASATASACEPCAVSSCAKPVRRNVSGAFLKLSEFDSCTRYRRMRPVVQYDSVVKDQAPRRVWDGFRTRLPSTPGTTCPLIYSRQNGGCVNHESDPPPQESQFRPLFMRSKKISSFFIRFQNACRPDARGSGSFLSTALRSDTRGRRKFPGSRRPETPEPAHSVPPRDSRP